MTKEPLTVGELKEVIEGVSDDETVCVARGRSLGEATKAYYNAEGVVIKGR